MVCFETGDHQPVGGHLQFTGLALSYDPVRNVLCGDMWYALKLVGGHLQFTGLALSSGHSENAEH